MSLPTLHPKLDAKMDRHGVPNYLEEYHHQHLKGRTTAIPTKDAKHKSTADLKQHYRVVSNMTWTGLQQAAGAGAVYGQ